MEITTELRRSESYEVTNYLTTRNERVEVVARILDQVTILITGWQNQPVMRIVSQQYIDNALAAGTLRIDAEETCEAKRRERSNIVTDDWFRPTAKEKQRKRTPTYTGERPPRRSHSTAEFAAMLNEI